MLTPQKTDLLLIVEDDPEILEIYRVLAEDLGYAVVTAADGLQALNQLESMRQLPCMILLDLMMPVMNGWQFLEQISKNPVLSNIPVVIVSAFDEESSAPLPVVERLVKPVTYQQLATTVAQYC